MAGNANSGRWPRGESRAMTGGNPRAKYAAERNPAPARRSRPIDPEPQPAPASAWDPRVKAWYRSLADSDLGLVAQKADWAEAWIAADLLDAMYERGFTPGLFREWHTIAVRLHTPRFDALLEADTDESDYDEANSIDNIRRLFAVGDDDDGD